MCSQGADKAVTLTNKAGKSLKAYLLTSDDQSVTVKMANARKNKYTIAFSALSAGSVAKIEEWKKNGGGLSEDFEITFKSGKSSALSTRENYDDRTLNLSPEVTIKNTDYKVKSGAKKVTLVLFGKSVISSRAYYVFSNETKDLTPLEEGAEETLQFKKIKIDYDDRGYAKYGSRYHGYVVLVHDGNGELSEMKAVPTTLLKHEKGLLKLKANRFYDKNLNAIAKPRED